jgi:hypothetical protein
MNWDRQGLTSVHLDLLQRKHFLQEPTASIGIYLIMTAKPHSSPPENWQVSPEVIPVAPFPSEVALQTPNLALDQGRALCRHWTPPLGQASVTQMVAL